MIRAQTCQILNKLRLVASNRQFNLGGDYYYFSLIVLQVIEAHSYNDCEEKNLSRQKLTYPRNHFKKKNNFLI